MKFFLLVAIPAAIILLILKILHRSGAKQIVIALLLSFASSLLLEVVQALATGKAMFYDPFAPIGIAVHGALVFAATIVILIVSDYVGKERPSS